MLALNGAEMLLLQTAPRQIAASVISGAAEGRPTYSPKPCNPSALTRIEQQEAHAQVQHGGAQALHPHLAQQVVGGLAAEGGGAGEGNYKLAGGR